MRLGNQRHKINAPSAATLLGLARAAEQGTTTTAAAAAAKQGTTTARSRPGDVIGRLDELSHRFLSEIKEFVEVRHPEHARVVDQTIEVPAPNAYGEMGTSLGGQQC